MMKTYEELYDPIDPWTTDPIKLFLIEKAYEWDCFEDCPPLVDVELAGLTILEKPHITASGTIVESRL